jgi:hypothetical protein
VGAWLLVAGVQFFGDRRPGDFVLFIEGDELPSGFKDRPAGQVVETDHGVAVA